ncbi:DUF3857 domain-containing protein [Sinomicrobium pectinilyticum]|uniref:DUF3857 domain-containing protein n=1 Tax=Sinomicrobium pectinilyticum TaxID=1084421 RepID=A0A3N0EUY9_SINP1|nr:DUF3857 domain-containing protein [Sinomicrobium pectinilyticum]RNL91693.1 DUF3857 domain-containing protein [Sinomicrobium pectinilyticum]
MEQIANDEKFRFHEPGNWIEKLDDEQLKSLIRESDFSRKQADEGRDYCYFLNKVFYTEDHRESDYVCMAYTLNEPANLEQASAYDMVLEDNETYHIHRINVLREGQLIDKIPDTSIKVLDDENRSGGGILNSTKKINVSIRDLRLYDVLILEDSREKIFTDRDFLRREFCKYVWMGSHNYWAYGTCNFKFINRRSKTVAYKKTFFRDEQGHVQEPETGYLKTGETFELNQENYINPTDSNREISPYIDFATDSNWEELSGYISPFYEDVYNKEPLEKFAPEVVRKLDALPDKDEQLKYALDFVQNRVYYVYNAYEMNGHKPQEPSVTYANKQGDCKAKTVLLKVILDHLEIASSVVLVNYNTDFYFKYYLPSLLSFNHVVVKIDYKGETYFVDATTRDDFGTIENRNFISFLHYLEIKQGQDLQLRKPFVFPKYCIDEKVEFNVEKNIGKLTLTTVFRYNRANNMRRYFKNTSKREIIDNWNNIMFYNLNYNNDRNNLDSRDVFKNASIGIINDDKESNEVTIQYSATIENPYFTDNKGTRFLMYFDRNVVKNTARDFLHKDITFWHNFDSERYEIHLYTDQKIDMKEKYTIQESTINNTYFTYNSRKKIRKNGGSAFIEYNPVANQEISPEDFESFREAHHRIADSNFGLGIDIIEPGLLNMLKFNIKKNFR